MPDVSRPRFNDEDSKKRVSQCWNTRGCWAPTSCPTYLAAKDLQRSEGAEVLHCDLDGPLGLFSMGRQYGVISLNLLQGLDGEVLLATIVALDTRNTVDDQDIVALLVKIARVCSA